MRSPRRPETRPTPVRRSATTWAQQPSICAQIAGDGPDIGALAATHLEDSTWSTSGRPDQLELVDPYLARLQLDHLAATGDVVGPLALHLDRRIIAAGAA